jgi:hypothetical protein
MCVPYLGRYGLEASEVMMIRVRIGNVRTFQRGSQQSSSRTLNGRNSTSLEIITRKPRWN